MTYRVTKTYGHERGLSACFRQHRADSHCRFLHGYALSFKFTFESTTLDERNWVVDFGSLKWLKAWLGRTFDHKTLVAKDDPYLDMLWGLDEMGLAQVVEVDAVGCEAFARLAYLYATMHLPQDTEAHGLRVVSVEVREHEGNSAIYFGGKV